MIKTNFLLVFIRNRFLTTEGRKSTRKNTAAQIFLLTRMIFVFCLMQIHDMFGHRIPSFSWDLNLIKQSTLSAWLSFRSSVRSFGTLAKYYMGPHCSELMYLKHKQGCSVNTHTKEERCLGQAIIPIRRRSISVFW